MLGRKEWHQRWHGESVLCTTASPDLFTGTGTPQWHQQESVVAVYNWTAVQEALLSWDVVGGYRVPRPLGFSPTDLTASLIQKCFIS